MKHLVAAAPDQAYTVHVLLFSQLARKCERVLIEKYLDVFYSEFLALLHNDKDEGE